MKILCHITLVLIFFSCNPVEEKNIPVSNVKIDNNKKLKNTFTLDSILSDKLTDLKMKTVRPNNFNRIKGLSTEILNSPSAIYFVKKLNNNLYLLQQKKRYDVSRHFNAMLRIKADTVSDFLILNDLSIKDLKINPDNYEALCDDWDNKNSYWKSEQKVQIIKLDTNLNILWKYEANITDYPLQAEKIKVDNKVTFYELNVIVGCHICFNAVDLELDRAGKFKSVRKKALQHAEALSQEKLEKIFQPKAN